MDVFFSAGRGGEEKASGHVQEGRFLLDDAQTHFFYVIYYISSSGGVAAIMTPATADGTPDPRCPGQTRALFKFRQGLLLFVYVCYMFLYVICLLYVVCLLYV